MARKPKAVRGKFADERYLGPEPDLRECNSQAEVMRAYSWYNYFYDHNNAKDFVIDYLNEFHKNEKELIKGAGRLNPMDCITIGWNCRILTLGGKLPQDVIQRTMDKIKSLIAKTKEPDPEVQEEKKETAKVSIQDRIKDRLCDLIGDIEEQIDLFTEEDSKFKIVEYLRQNNVKPALAQKIADYYKPLYAELYDAHLGKDDQLKEAYKHLGKKKLKTLTEFIREIVSESESRAVVLKSIRKPRKKKEKPASVIVGKMKFKEKDDELSLQSIRAADIIGSNQLWVFNTKSRNLSVYNAMGPAGLGVKGSSITGYDEKTSITKKLRKPKDQLEKLMSGGKIVLRKFMDEVKCKPKEANSRINKDTILLRITK